VTYKNSQWGKTSLPVQADCVGGGKAVSDPPTDPTPKKGYLVHDGRGGGSRQQTRTEGSGQEANMPRRDRGMGEDPSLGGRGRESSPERRLRVCTSWKGGVSGQRKG